MVQFVGDEKQGSRGSYSKLSIPDQILLTLQYWREYRTLFHIAQDWGVHESTAQRIVKRIEDMLIKSQRFSLPSKRELCKSKTEIEVVIIDVASTEIERPKKKQKQYYSGKQKCHTLKIQLLINQRRLEIICATRRKIKEHDFRRFKQNKINAVPRIEVIADKGIRESRTITNAVKPS